MYAVALAQSKVTSQGQISVPAEVRKKLGVGPGSVLQWDEEDGKVVIRRVGQFSSADVHAALFPEQPPKPRALDELKESVRRHMKAKHARR
jgi:AbrB family looped-hinge helix DNA binding protein